MEKLLRVENLRSYFYTDEGIIKAVDGVDLSLNYGETLALAGESGCGKSVTALSMIDLLPDPGRIAAGSIYFKGVNILEMSGKDKRMIRGREISMIFQDPFTSLNPVFNIGSQIAETIKMHCENSLSKAELFRKTVEILKLVEMPLPETYFYFYPHQLSGGMQQRAMIAMAISANPSLLIADEPTTALDLTVQAQIIDLLKRLQKKFNMGLILITHNLGIIAEIAETAAIMYLGRIVEYAPKEYLFDASIHPYTKGLLDAIPKIEKGTGKLQTIPGSIASSYDIPSGCKFHPRCTKKLKECADKEPPLEEVLPGRFSRCWRSREML